MVRLMGSSAMSKAAFVTAFVGFTTRSEAILTGVDTIEEHPKNRKERNRVMKRTGNSTKPH
jgi:hypothetical protein|tara:strand:- start:845 stop:1027 length:183 start_codon:yes stop_codon:yes gene_type:complete